jgi:REP element-mobilizing transposase RayT
MENNKIFYRRNLPHYQPDNSIYFVTFRLVNSLPKSAIEFIKREFKSQLKILNNNNSGVNLQKKIYLLQNKYFGKFDNLLNNNNKGSFWLKQDNIALIVSNAIHFYDEKKYLLFAFCIMPNHVHILFKIEQNQRVPLQNEKSDYIVTKILQDLKKFTAREANKLLGRSGQFWHHESYDHVVRNDNELENVYYYILQNPVKAGLVKSWKDWKWSFSKFI